MRRAGTYRLALRVAGIGYVGLAEVAYQRDELDAALGRPRPNTDVSVCRIPRIRRVRDLGEMLSQAAALARRPRTVTDREVPVAPQGRADHR